MIRLLYESWVRTRGSLLAVIGLIVSVVAYYVIGDWNLIGKITFPLLIIVSVCCAVSFDAFIVSSNKVLLPKIIRVIPAHKPYNNHSCILVTESCPLFGHDSYVTVYRKDSECEIMTAQGTVLNKQENGYLQIGITFLPETEQKFIDKIRNNDASITSLLLVKPTITKYVLEASI